MYLINMYSNLMILAVEKLQISVGVMKIRGSVVSAARPWNTLLLWEHSNTKIDSVKIENKTNFYLNFI
jgi:hypothetical protein